MAFGMTGLPELITVMAKYTRASWRAARYNQPLLILALDFKMEWAMRDRLLAAEKVKAIDWRDDALYLLDQRVLPFEETWHAYTSAAGVAEAIRSMVVRGAPAIGISAAYGVVLGARARIAAGGDWRSALEDDFALLADSRPTAVNLFWALDRMRDRLARLKEPVSYTHLTLPTKA